MFLSKYLSKLEILGWVLCLSGMLVIVLAKDVLPEMLPYAWAGAILGAGILGFGMASNKRK